LPGTAYLADVVKKVLASGAITPEIDGRVPITVLMPLSE